MSGEPVISVKNVSKAYRIWESPTARLLSPLLEGASKVTPGALGRNLARKATGYYRDFWALKDVAFEVRKGESIGIIGRNGSGKSTLLQIIAGTLRPSTGSVNVTGRISALLELGSGFNPEFTGRENIYLCGAVLGVSKQEMDRRFEEIAAFADIGAYMDQPIKTYSSGMTVRVAFAVQTAVNPDILIVDEALAVGDEAFQRKCFARIETLKKGGTTLLFVSHGAAQVVELCNRAILLSSGEVEADGAPKAVVNRYHQQLYGRAESGPPSPPALVAVNPSVQASDNAAKWVRSVDNRHEPTDDSFLGRQEKNTSLHAYPEIGARILRPRIFNALGHAVDHLRRGCAYRYSYDIEITSSLQGVRFGAAFKTLSGLEIAGMTTHRASERIEKADFGKRYRINFTFRCRLLPGSYFANAGVLTLNDSGEEVFAHRLVDACFFRVMPESDLPVNAVVDILECADIAEIGADDSND